jgi:hypothetical protein
MNYYKLKYADGSTKIVKAESAIDCIKTYDLATKEHVNTRIILLEGEQLAIAIANESGE